MNNKWQSPQRNEQFLKKFQTENTTSEVRNSLVALTADWRRQKSEPIS